MTIEELKKQGIDSFDTFRKMVQWGWCDTNARSLPWRYWHRDAARNRSE